MKTIRILILEDDLKTLSVITDKLFELEEEIIEGGRDIAVTVISEYTTVENFLNKNGDSGFDIILLDRDCKLCGSFHVLDFEKFDPNKIIAISTNVEYNDAVVVKGVNKVCRKDYRDLEKFGKELLEEIKKML
jgi:hypothetical protein